jgi:anti-sigma regulatory factor (Ser/Thr protein kinase)
MSTGRQHLPSPMHKDSYRALRLWTRTWALAHPVDGVDVDDITLVTVELVSNAMRHGAGPVDLELQDGPGTLRVSVGDSSEVTPRLPAPHAMAPGGRGLMILGALGRWGVDRRPAGGKTVWCELASP